LDLLVTIGLNGLTQAMVIALIAIGLAVIFGLRGVVNLAQGEFMMLGAYVVVVADRYLPTFWPGLVLAPVIIGLAGAALERLVIRRVYSRPLDMLLVTWGLSIILREVIRLVFGAGYQYATAPISGQATVLGIEYPAYRLFVLAVSTTVLAATFGLLLWTDLGLRVRAAIENRNMAAALGVAVGRVDTLVFAFGAGLAALAGAVLSPQITIRPEMGLDYLALMFVAVVVGGVRPLWGVIGGAMLIGGGTSVLSALAPPIVAQIAVLIAALLVLRFRPQGIFGRSKP
jgi:urea transport system permease protein